MNALRRLLCRLGIHVPPHGTNYAWSLYFVCACGERRPGGLARVRR